MVAKYGVVPASARRQAKPATAGGPRLSLKLPGLSKKDGEADNGGEVVEDKREGEKDMNPAKRRKIDSGEAVTRAKRAPVVKTPRKRKTGGR
jgi:hypothetical protein